jgi:ATP-dependent DNA helicase DinG
MQRLADIFGPGGTLAGQLPGYSFREAQLAMAEHVAAAIDGHHHAVLEAGTGTGKTFAYLIPVLLSGQRAIISTGTRTLQDQLFSRDLPMLGALLGRPAQVALLKGRANYFCRHRYRLAATDLHNPRWHRYAGMLDEFSRITSSGDLAELTDLPEDAALIARITSTVDNCLGNQCPDYDQCFVLGARRRAQAADVVVVNHHLLLADMVLRETGFGELLPQADAVIVDEAHLLPEIAQHFFGVGLGSRELGRLARDTQDEADAAGLGSAVAPLTDRLQREAAAVLAGAGGRSGRLPWHAIPRTVTDDLLYWQAPLEEFVEALTEVADASPGLSRCRERAADALARLRVIAAADSLADGATDPGAADPASTAGAAEREPGLRWLEVSPRSVTAHWTPADTGKALGGRIAAQGGHWIFASATLAVAGGFEHFLARVGVPEATGAVFASPFDYQRCARIWLPQGLPQPSSEDHTDVLLATVWPLIEAAGGGAFLLFTSYRALERAEVWLAGRAALPGPLLVQGRGARGELLQRFREAGNAVLLGTGSFWQGVDVRGSALRLVVIDKLPFAVPSDPLIRARLDAIQRAGGDGFNEFQLPQAVLALKQGVGRLIRDDSDRGLVVIGDPRLRTRGYGRVFMNSLPAMPVLDEADEALAFAEGLKPRIASAGDDDDPDSKDTTGSTDSMDSAWHSETGT